MAQKYRLKVQVMSNTIILQIESASKNCSVALSKDGEILAIKELHSDQFVHSEKLHLFIKEVMDKAEVPFDRLNAVAVGKGPGSYTGLRIGVSAAKGICFSLNIPLLSMNSLEVLSKPLVNNVSGFIVPMMDARRMEVYGSIYSDKGALLKPTEALILQPDTFLEFFKEEVHFLGDGSEKYRDMVANQPNAVFHDILYPSARDMCAPIYQKYLDEDFEDTAYFEPFYLKDFVAGKPKKLL